MSNTFENFWKNSGGGISNNYRYFSAPSPRTRVIIESFDSHAMIPTCLPTNHVLYIRP